MSRSPGAWPDSEDDAPLIRIDNNDNYVSEFLSERSPEFEAVRRAAADARRDVPAGPPQSATSPSAAPLLLVPTATSESSADVTTPPTSTVPWSWLVGVAGIATAVVAIAWLIAWPRYMVPAAAPTPAPAIDGMATIVSRPSGAEVLIDGVSRGETPLQLSMPAGTYAVQIRANDVTRDLSLTVSAGTAVREVVDLIPTVAPTRLEITSDVVGARVSIDGVPAGVTPLVVDDIAPGAYLVAISAADQTVYRNVTVEAGATASVTAAVSVSALSGWLTFTAPFDMQVFENGRLIGTTTGTRLMLPAGAHELELVAEAYGVRTTVATTVGGGRTTNVAVPVPNGQLSINAIPWADVWVNGQALGSTPLANVPLTVGDHEVVWRHPQLGERRQTVRVGATEPARVNVDLNR